MTLETKSTGLLSLIAVAAPLTATAAVFIRQQALPVTAGTVTLTLDILAMVFLLLGFVAALRALAVREHSELFLKAVIDVKSDTIQEYTPDYDGRGLLWVAANRQALCDHIADFVRAAQLFLVLGVTAALCAASPALFFDAPDTQSIAGEVTIDPKSIDAFGGALAAMLADPSARISRMESQLDSLRQSQSDLATDAEVARLSQEIAELRREIEAQQRRAGGRSTRP